MMYNGGSLISGKNISEQFDSIVDSVKNIDGIQVRFADDLWEISTIEFMFQADSLTVMAAIEKVAAAYGCTAETGLSNEDGFFSRNNKSGKAHVHYHKFAA